VTTIPESEMPAPRLELRWIDLEKPHVDHYEYTVECVYSLVLPLGEFDIRRERVADDGTELPDAPTHSAELGRTRSTGNSTKRYWEKEDAIDTPYRDGAHAHWDAKHLGNLPIYAVAAGRAMLVAPRS
jgi:hypothetical protein